MHVLLATICRTNIGRWTFLSKRVPKTSTNNTTPIRSKPMIIKARTASRSSKWLRWKSSALLVQTFVDTKKRKMPLPMKEYNGMINKVVYKSRRVGGGSHSALVWWQLTIPNLMKKNITILKNLRTITIDIYAPRHTVTWFPQSTVNTDQPLICWCPIRGGHANYKEQCG